MADARLVATNPEDSSLVPVACTPEGWLRTEGGTEGPPGPEGPEGPAGPPGPGFELPADPYEGAFLGWVGGELAWVGTPPVPVPEGLFGPILSYDSGVIEVSGGIPDSVASGVYLTQCLQDGTPINPLWNQSEDWAAILRLGGQSVAKDVTGFDGLLSTKAESGSGPLWFRPPDGIQYSDRVEIACAGDVIITFNEASTSRPENNNWTTIASGSGSITSINSTRISNPSNAGEFSAIKVDGKILVQPEQMQQFRVTAVPTTSTIVGISVPEGNLSFGTYLAIPEQRVAARIYYSDAIKKFGEK